MTFQVKPRFIDVLLMGEEHMGKSHNLYYQINSLTTKKQTTKFSSANFYVPNFGEVEGAYWFEPVRPSVRLSVILWQLRNPRTA